MITKNICVFKKCFFCQKYSEFDEKVRTLKNVQPFKQNTLKNYSKKMFSMPTLRSVINYV